MSIEANKTVVRQLFTRISSGDVDGVQELLTDDMTWLILGKREDLPSARQYDKAGIARLFQYMLDQLSDGLRMSAKGMVAEGNKVAVEAESYGELTNGRIYNQHYHFLIEFRDGKICAVREYLDTQHAHSVWFEPVEAEE